MSSFRSIAHHVQTYLFGAERTPIDRFDNIGDGFIFVHIPKNAGSSIADVLGVELSWHHTAQSYRDMLGAYGFEERFSFGFVRNPWDRFLSLYRYARLNESRYHSAIDPESAPHGKHEDYDLLCDATVEECARYLQEGRLQHDNFINHWRPQSDWLTDTDGSLIVDFVGRVESIQSDFQVVADRLNLDVDTLPVTNTSDSSTAGAPEREYRSAFSTEARRVVAEHYQEDIERWGYEF